MLKYQLAEKFDEENYWAQRSRLFDRMNINNLITNLKYLKFQFQSSNL